MIQWIEAGIDGRAPLRGWAVFKQTLLVGLAIFREGRTATGLTAFADGTAITRIKPSDPKNHDVGTDLVLSDIAWDYGGIGGPDGVPGVTEQVPP